MHASTILGFFLASLAVAAPAPSSASSRALNEVTFVMTEPDCAKLEHYCKNCNGDFNCETDPRCEWCEENGKF
ncbi:hypothetical protein F4777DRAFT_577091 [Nemania sp. FL0916]|nr:hypothetical protein F4777DRAFT_577091 [Nemania sp. FL0916]